MDKYLLKHVEGLLAKDKAELARVREAGPTALAPTPDEELSRMTVEELRGLLKSVEATLAVAKDRMKALGLKVDDVNQDDDNAVVD